MLADAGYDVWLGNARGTEPSREHVRLRPNGIFQKKYWEFSWHEIGMYDLPAIVDHILDTTHQKKLNYVGFSQGTTSFFVMVRHIFCEIELHFLLLFDFTILISDQHETRIQ